MITLSEINSILITLTVKNNNVLFLLLAADGTINRMGNGSPDCTDKDLYIGSTDTNKMIEELSSGITGEMLGALNRTYDIPNKKGRHCDLKIMLKTPTVETGIQFLYGELSQGPPAEVVNFVVKAMELTHSWHVTQKRTQSTANTTAKPWWKFW